MSQFESGNQPCTVFIIRHGDRFDYNIGKDVWDKIAQRRHDPVLSDLGNKQAMELGHYFKTLRENEKGLDFQSFKVLTSPFVRCIQTANPIAGALDASLLVENSLWEIVYTKEVHPPLTERAAYFPRIDLEYESIFRPALDEPFPVAALERYAKAAYAITERFEKERGMVMVTHAAGVVGIVATLLQCSLSEVEEASPCGIFRLDRASPSSPWILNESCNGYTDHMSELGNTKSWPDKNDPDKSSWSHRFLAANWSSKKAQN